MKRAFPVVGILALIVLVIAGCSLLRMTPDVDFEASVTEGRVPLAVQFTAQIEGTPVSCTWNFGDGRTSNDPNPVHVYTSRGTYSVMLTVGFADGDSVTRIRKRLVTADPQLPQAPQFSFDLYWISEASYKIRRGTRDGSLAEDVVSNAQPPSGFDIAGGRIYWVTTLMSGGILESAALDGSDRQTLVREENRMGDVAVDSKRGKIYWTSLPESPLSLVDPGEGAGTRTWDGGLRCADLDGSNVETLIEYPSGSAVYADRVAVAPYAAVVFWTVVGDDYEGVIREAIVEPASEGFRPYATDFETGVGRPRDMALDIVPYYGAKNLYYTTGDELRRIGLFWDWFGSKETILSGLNEPSGIAVDSIGYYVYFGTPDGIMRVVTDGTGLEMLFDHEQGVGSMVLSP